MIAENVTYQNFEELRKNLIDNEGLFFHPGLKEDGRQLFKGWTPEKKLGGVNSDFVVAFSLLRSDICDYGKDYIRIADPNFLNRTMQGIIGMRFSNAETKEDIKVGKTRLKKLLPDPLHGRIDYLRKMAEWVDPKKF